MIELEDYMDNIKNNNRLSIDQQEEYMFTEIIAKIMYAQSRFHKLNLEPTGIVISYEYFKYLERRMLFVGDHKVFKLCGMKIYRSFDIDKVTFELTFDVFKP